MLCPSPPASMVGVPSQLIKEASVLLSPIRGWHSFCKGSGSKYVGSTITAQLCSGGGKAVVDDVEMNAYGFVPIKLYLLK